MVLAAVVIPAAIAYACNPQAHISVQQTGNTVTVYGSYFPANAGISISGSWGTTASAKASPGGGFQVSLTAPSTPGNYSVSASRPTGGFAPASFTVAAPAPAPAPEPAQSSTPAATAPPVQASKTAPAFKSPKVARSDAPASAERTTPPKSGGTSSGSGATNAGSGSVAGNVTSSTGQQVFSGSTAAAAAPTFATEPATASPARTASSRSTSSRGTSTATAPAQQAALSDLFSDYQPGRTPSLMGSPSGAPDGGAGSGLGLGLGLLAFGFLALAAGLTAAEVRRRRPA